MKKLIDLNIIARIESGYNPYAWVRTTGARGLFQITPIVLKEYNQWHKTAYEPDDLFSIVLNVQVARWYFEERIPQMLSVFKYPINLNNVLICYHDGIGNFLKYKKGERQLGPEMLGYLAKYDTYSKNRS